jgi:hypothetical protein
MKVALITFSSLKIDNSNYCKKIENLIISCVEMDLKIIVIIEGLDYKEKVPSFDFTINKKKEVLKKKIEVVDKNEKIEKIEKIEINEKIEKIEKIELKKENEDFFPTEEKLNDLILKISKKINVTDYSIFPYFKIDCTEDIFKFKRATIYNLKIIKQILFLANSFFYLENEKRIEKKIEKKFEKINQLKCDFKNEYVQMEGILFELDNVEKKKK